MVVALAIGASNVATARAPVGSPTRTMPPQNNEPLVDESNPASRLIECCHALLSERGEVSGAVLATDALSVYRSLAAPAIDRFFDRLVAEYSADADDVRRSSDAYSADPSPAHLMRLYRAIETPRVELFLWTPYTYLPRAITFCCLSRRATTRYPRESNRPASAR